MKALVLTLSLIILVACNKTQATDYGKFSKQLNYIKSKTISLNPSDTIMTALYDLSEQSGIHIKVDGSYAGISVIKLDSTIFLWEKWLEDNKKLR